MKLALNSCSLTFLDLVLALFLVAEEGVWEVVGTGRSVTDALGAVGGGFWDFSAGVFRDINVEENKDNTDIIGGSLTA